MVSVILSVYNEAKTITDCLSSLAQQSYQPLEIIVIDDGSTDNTILKIKNQISNIHFKDKKFTFITQKHQGPGIARNLGTKKAKGDILVFVDADMTFDKNFIKNLINPIVIGHSKGAFTKNEYVSNWDNVWARCWNYNQGLDNNRRIPENYPDQSPVFRAILKSEFEKVGGFDNIGFTDDWTPSRKLGLKATLAHGAICYHRNPETLAEVYSQARWIGKNEFISGTLLRRIISLIRYNFISQLIRGLYISLKYNQPAFIIFQIVYYLGIKKSILLSFLGEAKFK